MNKYFISRGTTKFNHAGSKAVNDADSIMENSGYNRITIYPARSGNPIIRKLKNRLSLNNLNKIEENSIVVTGHPLYINPIYIHRLKELKQKKNLKLYFLIHDFETERKLFKDDAAVLEVERNILEICDGMIVHNPIMAKLFVEKYHVDESKLLVLGLFDYLCEIPETKADPDNQVVIAGNLNSTKSGYVYKAIEACPDVTFGLYGVNFEKSDERNNYTYYGSVDADELPGKLNGKFGLVWDGPVIDSCEGPTGQYLRINNPHKTSLYVAGEVPPIVWSESAVARFVEDNHIGFSVSSLAELNDKINNVSAEEYAEYKKNLANIAPKVRNGGFLKAVLEQIESRK